MKFCSEAERMQHPQARLIPFFLWSTSPFYTRSSSRHFFDEKLSPVQLILMQTPKAELKTTLESLNPKAHLLNHREKICLALAIALANPDFNDQELLQISRLLDLRKDQLFLFTCLLGKVDFFQACIPFYSDVELKMMVAEHNYQAFSFACTNGQLALIKQIIKLVPDKTQAMIAADQYAAFYVAAENGQIAVMEYLIQLAPESIEAMLSVGHYRICEAAGIAVMEYLIQLQPDFFDNLNACYRAFYHFAAKGQLPSLELLIKKIAESHEGEIEEIIAEDDYSAFRIAATHGHLAVMERLIELVPDKVQEMIAAQKYGAFQEAAGAGQLAAMEYLISLASDKVQEMIASCNYAAFHFASNGHLADMERLMELMPDKVQEMIAAENYQAFYEAASHGHLRIVERLIELAPDKTQAMIASNQYAAFRLASRGGHLEIIERLMALAPAEIQNMIAVDHYAVFIAAAQNGHLAVLERLIELAPDKVQEMIFAENYSAFREAAFGGHLPILDRLIELAPEKVQAMMAAENYSAFRSVVGQGQFVLKYLIELAPEKIQEMIAADNYEVFCVAGRNGNFAIIEHLIQLAPEQKQNMLASGNFAGFRNAAEHGHLEVLELLFSELAPERVQDMMKTCFDVAVSENQLRLINYFLPFPWIFAYAEVHEEECGYYVEDFTSSKLKALRALKVATEAENPHAIFDIVAPEEANLLFYFLRNYIRRNDASWLDDMRFLLEIPAVKNLVHRAITPGIENELLRLAIRIGNQQAIELLLTLPAVHQLAQINHYYPGEAQGPGQEQGLDLQAVARDRESSLQALSTGEQKRLEHIINRYQPKLRELGIPRVMNGLRHVLAQRYVQNPASIMQSKEGQLVPLVLPLKSRDLQALALSPADREEALKAFYQHKEHTVLRYLTKPNPFMHEQANYVYRAPQIPGQPRQQWSTFEDYQSIISLLFLAVIDQAALPTEGYSMETRLEHFIDELAHIGRAHNWDNTRAKVDAENNVILDHNGKAVTEEYDDLEGDRPSCYSGVKRRLFQSVMGHPLVVQLSKDILRQQMQEFVYAHFQAAITDDNRALIKKAFDETICCSEEEEEKEEEKALRVQSNFSVLKALDISPAQQQIFVSHLIEKYGPQFNEDEELQGVVSKIFALKEDEAHVLKLAYFGVQSLLEKASDAMVLSRIGLHARPVTEEEEQGLRASKRQCL